MKELKILTDIPEPHFEYEALELRGSTVYPQGKEVTVFDTEKRLWLDLNSITKYTFNMDCLHLVAIPKKSYSYDWPDVFPDGTQLAMDSEGTWYFYPAKVRLKYNEMLWLFQGNRYPELSLPPFPEVPLSDWKNSLIVKGAK